MGTVFSFDVPDLSVDIRPSVRWLHEVDARFSTYRPDSEVSRLRRGDLRPAECHPDVRRVLEIGRWAEVDSGGAFTLTPTGALDPSGVVKGWAVEHAASLLVAAGSRSHLINGGGDVQTHGTGPDGSPWRVAITHPFIPRRVLAVVQGAGIAVATSGTAERGAHVTDGRTGESATALRSVTVVGYAGLTEVDIAATTALALGPGALAWLSERPHLAALTVDRDGAVRRTENWSEYVDDHSDGLHRRAPAGQPGRDWIGDEQPPSR